MERLTTIGDHKYFRAYDFAGKAIEEKPQNFGKQKDNVLDSDKARYYTAKKIANKKTGDFNDNNTNL
jgi:hypothetical protein